MNGQRIPHPKQLDELIENTVAAGVQDVLGPDFRDSDLWELANDGVDAPESNFVLEFLVWVYEYARTNFSDALQTDELIAEVQRSPTYAFLTVSHPPTR